jgi:hypothetical protein
MQSWDQANPPNVRENTPRQVAGSAAPDQVLEDADRLVTPDWTVNTTAASAITAAVTIP